MACVTDGHLPIRSREFGERRHYLNVKADVHFSTLPRREGQDEVEIPLSQLSPMGNPEKMKASKQ